ncbi:MAG TPA: hypothetical protein VD996_10790 [Chitinophagaceae bacterium]|nr:hypothetical protein [Chitinophagaceae bacterium]
MKIKDIVLHVFILFFAISIFAELPASRPIKKYQPQPEPDLILLVERSNNDTYQWICW